MSPYANTDLVMLFTLQRYEFFSKSQLHQRCNEVPFDVVYPTKVRIFQQITTVNLLYRPTDLMLFTLQRYEFFSKSQLIFIIIIMVYRCCLPYKGTNFSANHNGFGYVPAILRDVVYPTKVRIFQQITTGVAKGAATYLMLFTLQRYEFFSKSQQCGNNVFVK